jgi:hypothetical protein
MGIFRPCMLCRHSLLYQSLSVLQGPIATVIRQQWMQPISIAPDMSGVLLKSRWLYQLPGEDASCKMDDTCMSNAMFSSFFLVVTNSLLHKKGCIQINLKGVWPPLTVLNRHMDPSSLHYEHNVWPKFLQVS